MNKVELHQAAIEDVREWVQLLREGFSEADPDLKPLLEEAAIVQRYHECALEMLLDEEADQRAVKKPNGRPPRQPEGKYGFLTALEFAGYHKYPGDYSNKRVILWRCKCDCGRTVIKQGVQVRNGRIKACGHQCPIYRESQRARRLAEIAAAK